MAYLSISAAARAVGKDRSTISRYIKSGKLSVSKDGAGKTVLEVAELLRVFGALHGDGKPSATPVPAVQHDATHAINSSVQQAFETTLEILKHQLRVSQEREERLLKMLEHEQESRRELERRLLPPGTSEEARETTHFPHATSSGATAAQMPQSHDGDERSLFARFLGK